ncbi:MAG: DNA repair exonuclease [Thermoplasmata archaeon]|nr:DNA repair exonuclease [Thermoplasmata archaeon]
MGAQFRFVHCADLHLGARFRGMSSADPAAAERMRRSVFESFGRIVDAGIAAKADAMFIAGDAFDEETVTPMTRQFLVDQLRRFGKPVFICRGNHDPRTEWEDSMPYPENVHEFATEPEALPIPGVDGAEAVGASFADWHEERNLPSMIRGTPGKFTVACVHCDVGASTPEYDYSPCSETDFRGKGVDYWAIGHIHKRAIVSRDPWVVYSGNIQGRSFKETGEKGACIVTVRDGRVSDVDFVATQGIVWYDEVLDITGKTFDALAAELSDRVAPGSAVRVTLVGTGQLDRMAREKPEDMARMLSQRIRSEVSGMEVRSMPEVDLEARRGGRDMLGLVISQGDSLRGSRKRILAMLSRNPVLKTEMRRFEAMSDDELASLVDSAVRTLASRMEASR